MRMKRKNNIKKVGMQYFMIPIGVLALTALNISAKSIPLTTIEPSIVQETQTEQPDVYPEFPGGQKAMMEYFMENLVYPADAKEKNIEGKVFVSFVVTKKGKIRDVKIKKGTESSLDQAAIKVIESMPDWKPGKKDGKTINAEMVLPIVYKLPVEKE